MIRRFKPAYWLFNYFKKEELKHNIPLFEKYGIKKKYYASISSEDFEKLDSPKNKYDTIDSSKYISNEEEFKNINPQYREALKSWSNNGYAILENFFSTQTVEAINDEVAALIKNKSVKFRYHGKKIMFAFHVSPLIREIGNNKDMKRILRLLMGKEMELFQSINFIKASEQRTHSDSIHMTTFPLGNLIAVWIALEDVTENNGPLHYYPGSHKLPYIMNKDFDNRGSTFFLGSKTYFDYEDKIEQLIEEKKLKKEVFLAGKGDVFIWHANLLHGGNKMDHQKLTRKSMVLHYYSEDAICYHEITQRPSLKQTHLRTIKD